MESYSIEPHYTTHDHTGRCVKCQAEHEMNNCLMALLGENGDESNEEAEKKFQALLNFLKSPESQKLVEESERLMADGKKVNVRLFIEGDKAKYVLEIE